jgi:hypothetical protein
MRKRYDFHLLQNTNRKTPKEHQIGTKKKAKYFILIRLAVKDFIHKVYKESLVHFCFIRSCVYKNLKPHKDIDNEC